MKKNLFAILLLAFFIQPVLQAQVSFTLPPNAPPQDINKAEYFLDTDPGFGNGKPIPISSGSDITLNNIAVSITGLATGVHRIFFRTKDLSGHWSEANVKFFAVLVPNAAFPANSLPGNITKLEYFVDHDPGFGNGTVITLAPGNDITTAFSVDVSGLSDGNHHLFIRTFDDWSLTNVQEFIVGTVVPVTWISFTGKWEKAPVYGVHLSWQTSAEVNNMNYVVERSVDGIHFKKIGEVAGGGATGVANNYSFIDDLKDAAPSPVFYYRIRQVDLDGKSSCSAVISLKSDFGETAQVFPNPTKGMFRLYLNKKPEAHSQLLIYDSRGVLVLRKNIDQVITNLDLSGRAKGIYFLKVVENGTIKCSMAVTIN